MKLRELHIKGFKSIDADAGQRIPLGDVTVLLGANGSGKSNLVSFFNMLNFMMTGALKPYVDKHGVSRLLFYGPKQTESISFVLQFEDGKALDTYSVRLSHGLPDRLFISGEKVAFRKKDKEQAQEYFLESTNNESGLKNDNRKTSKVLYSLFSRIRAYQFHDTSDTAKIKDRGYVDDARYLRHDAGNLAAFLKMLKDDADFIKYYKRIVRHIQRVMPQFGDFDLEPIPGAKDYVRLNWKDSSGNDYLFDPQQISDGSLRFMALATLLLQPPDLLPRFIVLDEPELGLHPAAIAELVGMVKIATKNSQVLLATQSTRLVDEFSPDELIVVERDEKLNCSVFKKLDSEELSDWLNRYSLSELWEKNVLGGQP
ncbi:MAG: AAA family ATPase [Desulfovibrio sp.]|jgi:predicted ATPase|nr:AAA family ATPase [Desulfovibrio sp.]